MNVAIATIYRATSVLKAQQDRRVLKVHEGHPEREATQGLEAFKVLPFQEQRGRRESQVLKGKLVQRVAQDRQASLA
jgi:hypothetical protein